MWGLRWVLLGLGALLVVGIYLWGRGMLRLPRSKGAGRSARVEPTVGGEPLVDEPPWGAESPDAGSQPPLEGPAEPSSSPAQGSPDKERTPPPETERVITLRLVSKGEPLNAQAVVLALRAKGLQHGRYGIFHRIPESGSGEPLFSVANLTEPGSFDLSSLAETTLPGMSFFMLLPGVGDPVVRFDMMVDTARSLALELDGELHDEHGSSWSIQRERYVREQVIEYRYQLERA